MPTGYTAEIKNGISFKTFALNCARAFGACVTLRDEAGGGEKIPGIFEPDDYHAKAEEKALSELAMVNSMSNDECERKAAKDYDDAETHRSICLRELSGLKSKYELMLLKARSWVPPTENHKGLHDFMIEQIEESINFDCNTSYYDKPSVRMAGAEWKAKRIAELNRDLVYHTEQYAKEVARAKERTDWIGALRTSLEVSA